ncbi:hypothetical protein LG212_26790 [Escherichia coli]|nr:hypothetical protein [Escherichia coli]
MRIADRTSMPIRDRIERNTQLHKISLCVECFLINNSADTPEKRESVLIPEMPTPHAKTSFC